MSDQETRQRAAILAEARSWLGTPYHHEARVKGAGVDCAQLLYAVYRHAGRIPAFDIPHYPPDWHLHRDTERYLGFVLDHAVEIAGPPLPGDIAIWKFGRCFSHGAIVLEWPRIIHAYVGRPCEVEDAGRASYLTHIGESSADHGKERPRKFFTLKTWED